MKSIGLLIIAGLMVTGNYINAQVNSDTLKLVYADMAAQQFVKADGIVQHYLRNHPDQPEALKLHAQLLTYSGQLGKAEAMYRRLIKLNNQDINRYCDFAEFLMDEGRYHEALNQLQKAVKVNASAARPRYLRAKAYYWEGNKVKAKGELIQLLRSDYRSEEVRKLSEDISQSMAANLTIEGTYRPDNQVMQATGLEAHLNYQRSLWWNPDWMLMASAFQTGSLSANKVYMKLSDAVTIPSLRMGLSASAAVFLSTSTQETALRPTFGLGLSKELVSHLHLKLYTERAPYLFNKNSIGKTVLQQETGVVLDYNKNEMILGKLGYQVNMFDDNNYVYAIYGWGLFPLYHSPVVTLSGGYGYNYSTSGEARFEPIQPITSWASVQYPVTGMYNPYFTPLKQQIHSLLMKVSWTPDSKWGITASGSYGIYAESYIPYLYLENNGSTGLPVAVDGSTHMTFTPFDISLKGMFTTHSQQRLELGYGYIRNNFYTCHQVSVKYSVHLHHGKR